MPVMMQRGRIELVRGQEQGSCQTPWDVTYDANVPCLTIGLINNMPDAALETTEAQFSELIGSAAGDIPVRLALYSLPNIPRSDSAQQHLKKFYFGIDELWKSQCDAVIITGTEPRRPNLREEAYWPVLADVFDWAERNTFSTVLSCLAAHAAVLYNDGVERHQLSDKRFGVFEFKRAHDHALTHGTAKIVRIPHSRWNEVREDDLVSCGYTVLAKSAEAGVDMFVKQRKQSLFVHFQGHPEYSARTLLKEYRRDIGRFLRRERETYPSMPQGYLNTDTCRLAEEFQQIAPSRRDEEILASFPYDLIANGVQNTWQPSATRVYRNWLQYVLSRKIDAAPLVAMPDSRQIQQKRSAA
jgi:homoserine O-succinyltransferase